MLGKSMSSELPKVMAAVWHLFEAAPAFFEALVLPHADDAEDGGQPGEGEGGAGGEMVTFETVVEQLYEFLLTVLGAASLQEQLKSALQVMTYNTITFMQVQTLARALCTSKFMSCCLCIAYSLTVSHCCVKISMRPCTMRIRAQGL